MRTISVILISIIFTMPVLIEAQAQGNTKKRIIYRKRSKVGFQDALVEGRTKNPEGIYIVTKPKRKFKGLLRLRTNFHKELIRDALLLK